MPLFSVSFIPFSNFPPIPSVSVSQLVEPLHEGNFIEFPSTFDFHWSFRCFGARCLSQKKFLFWFHSLADNPIHQLSFILRRAVLHSLMTHELSAGQKLLICYPCRLLLRTTALHRELFSGAWRLPCLMNVECLSYVSQDSKSAATIHPCTPVSFNISAMIYRLGQVKDSLDVQNGKILRLVLVGSMQHRIFPVLVPLPPSLQQVRHQHLEVFTIHPCYGSYVQPFGYLFVVQHQHDH